MVCSMLSQTNGMGLFLGDVSTAVEWEHIRYCWYCFDFLREHSVTVELYWPGSPCLAEQHQHPHYHVCSWQSQWVLNNSLAIKKILFILKHNIKMYFFVLEYMKIHEWQFRKECIESSIILLGYDICVNNIWVEQNAVFIIKPPHFMPLPPQKPSYYYQNPQKIFDNNIIIQTLSFKTCFCYAEHYLSVHYFVIQCHQ